MKNSLRLFKLFGIEIQLHFSWWLVLIFLTWSLSTGFFPQFFSDLPTKVYWAMGLTASLLLFISVLLHELAHSLVAKAKRIPVRSITLFFFGGVAGITKEEMKPSIELKMSLAGPLFSLILSGLFYLLHQFNGGSIFLTAISFYLYQLNFILAIFNLIPGYPLDGGRAFRAVLYWYYKDLKKATKIASSGGKFFAGFLVFLGVFGLFSGQGSGLWLIFLGGFLYFIANLSYQQVVVREVLNKISIRELMEKKFMTLNPKLKFSAFAKKYASSGQDVFMLKNKDFSGILDLKRIEKLPRLNQEQITLQQLSLPLSRIKTLKMEDNAYDAFQLFNEQDLSLLPIMKGKNLLGIVSRKKVLARLVWSLKFGSK